MKTALKPMPFSPTKPELLLRPLLVLWQMRQMASTFFLVKPLSLQSTLSWFLEYEMERVGTSAV